MSIYDIIGEDNDKFHDVNDIMLRKERIWLEPPYVAVSVLTGEVKDVRKFKKRKKKIK